jgi:hypothetical protein
MDTARIGGFAILGGATVTVAALIAGFFFLLTDQDTLAKPFLMLVPIGFLVTFTGLVMTVITEQRTDGRR